MFSARLVKCENMSLIRKKSYFNLKVKIVFTVKYNIPGRGDSLGIRKSISYSIKLISLQL